MKSCDLCDDTGTMTFKVGIPFVSYCPACMLELKPWLNLPAKNTAEVTVPVEGSDCAIGQVAKNLL